MSPEGGTEEQSPRLSSPPRLQPTYKFTPDELRVLRECNRESFYQRCLPLGTLFGFSTYYAVQTNYLKASPRFGAVPKVCVAVAVGYFAGKFSYQKKCAEKLMQLPNSKIGDMLRKRKSGTFQESLDTAFGPSMSLAPFGSMSQTDTYSDVNPKSNFDLDTSRPEYGGLDDTYRPSMDNNPVYEEEMPPEQKHVTTYEELRKKNREEYQQKRTLFGKGPAPTAPPSPSPSPPAPPPSAGPNISGPRNKYGDVWE